LCLRGGSRKKRRRRNLPPEESVFCMTRPGARALSSLTRRGNQARSRRRVYLRAQLRTRSVEHRRAGLGLARGAVAGEQLIRYCRNLKIHRTRVRSLCGRLEQGEASAGLLDQASRCLWARALVLRDLARALERGRPREGLGPSGWDPRSGIVRNEADRAHPASATDK